MFLSSKFRLSTLTTRLDSFRAPPAFRVAHPDTEFDTTLKPEDVESLDYNQLKAELKSRGVNASGKKTDLVSKLRQTLAAAVANSTQSSEATEESTNLAPPPSPATKTPKSALKSRKPQSEEPALPEPVFQPMKLDFSSEAPILIQKPVEIESNQENDAEVPKSPTKTPTAAQAKRQRRSSLALVGLPDQPTWRSPRRRSSIGVGRNGEEAN